MDHISKALERAQAERRSVRDWVRPEHGDAPTLEPVGGVDLSGQTLELDTQVLRDNHVLCGATVDDPVITDKYRLLRTRVLQSMKAQGWTKLGITSAGPRAGKTLNAINLAVSIARDGHERVCVIDADLRQPAVAQTLGVDPELGLIDFLESRATLEQIAVRSPQLPNVCLLPGRHSESDAEAPDRLRSTRMSRLLDAVDDARHSSFVIVDLPPVLIGDDVIAVAPLLDSMLLVIEEGGTDLEELKSTAELLAEYNLLGTVLNKSTERSKLASGYYETYGSR